MFSFTFFCLETKESNKEKFKSVEIFAAKLRLFFAAQHKPLRSCIAYFIPTLQIQPCLQRKNFKGQKSYSVYLDKRAFDFVPLHLTYSCKISVIHYESFTQSC